MSAPPSRARHIVALLVTAALASALTVIGPTPATAAPGPSLMFATYNVCKTMCSAPAPPWSVRRIRVARVLNESGADVIAVTEATDWPYRSRTQWQDIQRLAVGYATPVIQSDRCERFGCTHTARILIASSTVRQMAFPAKSSAGSWRVRDVAPDIRLDADRQVTWAFLEGTDAARPFLAISVHLSNAKTAEGEQHRQAFGRAVTAWADGMMQRRGLPPIPVVLMGDLNSIETRQPQGVQQVLLDNGWRDAIVAPDRTNVDISQINYTPLLPSGWPTSPIRSTRRLASRIDYIMHRGPVTPLTYEVVAHLNPDGTFDTAYQGSDHLMVRARLQFDG